MVLKKWLTTKKSLFTVLGIKPRLLALSPSSRCTGWANLVTVLKGNASEMKDRFKSFWIRLKICSIMFDKLRLGISVMEFETKPNSLLQVALICMMKLVIDAVGFPLLWTN